MTGYAPQLLFRALYTGSNVGGFQLNMDTSRSDMDARGPATAELKGNSINVEFKDRFGGFDAASTLEDYSVKLL